MLDSPSYVLSRLAQHYKCKNDKDLCLSLGVASQSTLRTWRSRDKVPSELYRVCVRVSKQDALDLFWLLTGEQSEAQQKTAPPYHGGDLTDAQRALLDTLAEDMERLNRLEQKLEKKL